MAFPGERPLLQATAERFIEEGAVPPGVDDPGAYYGARGGVLPTVLFVKHAWLFVDFFFVLSGFLITKLLVEIGRAHV